MQTRPQLRFNNGLRNLAMVCTMALLCKGMSHKFQMFNVNAYFNCMLLLNKLGTYFGPKNIGTLGKMIVIDHLLNYAIASNLI